LSDVDPLKAAKDFPNSLESRVVNEERKLNHQLEVAQQVREIAAENGNAELLETASRMESMAADRYVRKLETLGVFEESIPLPNTALLQPLIDAPPPPGT
jgi:hypothetical protein